MYEQELSFATELAERAAAIGMAVFRHDVRVTIKADLSPVTQADTEIEIMAREAVAAAFPHDRIVGEEQGGDASGEGRIWIVDPIDATANFARGIPIWATLIALQIDGEPVLGIANAPALGERYVGVTGGGATCNGRPITVSDVGALADAQLLFAGLRPWATTPRDDAMLETFAAARRTRGFGDFWGHMLVARGSAEAMIESELALWDYAALVPVVREAGGRITTIDGGPLRHGSSVLSTNGVMHDELVARLSG